MKTMLCLLLCLAVLCVGCNGVILTAKYSSLLDETAAISRTAFNRADAGLLDANGMKQSLRWNADTWQKFQDARDGRASE